VLTENASSWEFSIWSISSSVKRSFQNCKRFIVFFSFFYDYSILCFFDIGEDFGFYLASALSVRKVCIVFFQSS